MDFLSAAAASRGSLVVCLWGCGLGSHVDDWEGLEWILRSLVFKALLISRPGCTFDVETVDADTFRRHLECLLNATIVSTDDFFLHFGLWLDGIERPFLLGVLSGDLLHRGSEETLRVIETSEPE